MKFLTKNTIYDYDLMDSYERNKANQFFKTRNSKLASFLNGILSIYSKIKGFEELTEQELIRICKSDRFQGDTLESVLNKNGEQSLCFCYFDVITNFFHIYLNYEKIDKEKEINVELVSFILLHQIVHGYFGHFTRPIIQRYSERNKVLSHAILDAQVNSFLIKALNYKISNKKVVNTAYEYIQENFATLEKLYDWTSTEYNITPDFDLENDFVSIGSIMKSMDRIFDDTNMILPVNLGSFDSHEGSELLTDLLAEELNIQPDRLNEMNQNSINYLEATARAEGFGVDELLRSAKKAEMVTKSCLEIVKLNQILRMSGKVGKKKTWRRVNKKREYDDGICMKGKISLGKKKIVVGVDVSGSVSDDEMNLFKSHISRYAKSHAKDVVIDYFVWSSCKIEAERDLVKNLTVKSLNEHETYSGGGTCFETVAQFINKQYKGENITFINITDGYYSRANTRLDTDIVKDYYGILTCANMTSDFMENHRDENVKGVHEIRFEVTSM